MLLWKIHSLCHESSVVFKIDAKYNTSCIDKPSPLIFCFSFFFPLNLDTGQIENLHSLNPVACCFKS